MARTNIDIDDELCARVMARPLLSTKREPLDLDEARSLRGSGWCGNLDAMRSSRV